MGALQSLIYELKQSALRTFGKSPIGAEVEFDGVRVRCSDHRTYEENLIACWETLRRALPATYQRTLEDEDAFVAEAQIRGYRSYG